MTPTPDRAALLVDPHQPISFAAACREEADFLQSETGGCNSPDCYGHSSMRERAAVLMQLATLCERAEKVDNTIGEQSWICTAIANGYQPDR